MYQAVHLSLYVGHTCLCIDHVKAAGRGEGHGSGIMCIRVRFSGHTSALRVLHMSVPVTTAMWHMPSCLAKPTIAIGNNSDSYKYPHAQRKYQRLGEGRYPIEPATTPEPISPGSSSLCARRPIREEGPLVPHETCQWPECDRDDVDDTTDSVFLLGATAYGAHQHT